MVTRATPPSVVTLANYAPSQPVLVCIQKCSTESQIRGPKNSPKKARQYNTTKTTTSKKQTLIFILPRQRYRLDPHIFVSRRYQNQVCSAMMIPGGVQNGRYHSIILHLCQERQNRPFIRAPPPACPPTNLKPNGVCLLRPPPLLADDNIPTGNVFVPTATA